MKTIDTEHHSLEGKKDISQWKKYQLILFRIAFVFFTLICIPLSLRYYETLFSLNWFKLGYRDLTNLGRFSPNLINIESESGRWGLASYVDYALILGVAILLGIIWTLIDRQRKNYNLLYYWLKVLVRYRIAIGMIEFGFVKVFLIQMPEAPLGTLHTNLGDITAQKLYWLSVGVVPWYEIVLGLVEVIAGSLLFFRKTVFLGALLTAGASANIVFINFAYDGGVHVYSSYFVFLSVFLLIPYLPEYYKLLVKEENVYPVRYYPKFDKIVPRVSRYVLKSFIMILFLGVLSYLHVKNRLHKPFIKEPITAGIKGATGYYDVSVFKINNQSIPYSPHDTLRWHDATFEKYSTITFKTSKPISLDLSNGVPQKEDIDRKWELTGIAGRRQYYYYEADTLNKVLRLFNKNAGKNNTRKKNKMAKKKEDFMLFYEIKNNAKIILKGTDKNRNSIYVELDKMDKKYALRNEIY